VAAESDHIALANKNHAVLMYLLAKPTDFPEWITTVAFYKAVHIVEAVFVTQLGTNCRGHEGRLTALQKPRFGSIYIEFRPLWGASSVARYLYDNDTKTAYKCFSDFLPPEKVSEKIVLGRLRKIEQACTSLLSEQGKTDLVRFDSSLAAKSPIVAPNPTAS
jgi:hypothetical protein